MQLQGQVVSTRVDEKFSQRTQRPFKVHYITLSDGNEVNVGFKNPYTVGQNVSLNVEQKYNEWHISKGPSVAPQQGASVAQAPKRGAFPVDKQSDKMSIIRQNSLTNAVKTYAAMFPKGVPTNQLAEEVTDAILKIAYKYTDFSSGHREEKMVDAMMEQSEENA